jgi:hypothetical protein
MTGDYRSSKTDPALLIIGQSFALGFNITASVVFIARLSGADPLPCTYVTIGSLCLAVLLDLICMAVFGASHSYPMRDGYELSAAFYLTLTSAIMSSISIGTLIADLLALRHNPMQFLTAKQRSLSLMSSIFMLYLLLASLVFKYVMERR